MIKILAVGNSFSQDATALLEFLTPRIHVRNLYIPGCPLSYHAELTKTGARAYELQEGGEKCVPQLVSLEEGLQSDAWDYITVQQVSGLAGEEESYEPHLSTLLAYLRRNTKAQLVFHRTWAYEDGSDHPEFIRYGCSRVQMEKAVLQATEAVCREKGLPVIPVGDLIARLRTHAFFDPSRGGLSLSRDGFHLSLNFGRCAAAAVWAKYFTGEIPAFFRMEDLSVGYRLIADELKKMP